MKGLNVLENIIEISNLCKIYKTMETVYALNNISLEIKDGEFVAIIGQSGSGKTTLMNILGCLDIPTSGKYLLDGHDISKFKDNKLSYIRNMHIGFIFQGFNLIPSLTALENVELPLLYRGYSKSKRRQKAYDALKSVELESRMLHLPSQMSGGQQQRVAIARAIAAKPPIILADEPTGNLDSSSGVVILDILKTLNKKGRTVILITHDNSVAAEAFRTITIKDGNIV